MFRRLSFIASCPNRSDRVGLRWGRREGRIRSARERQSDVNALLRSTFANLGKMQSATVDLKVRIEPRGANAAAGTVAARLQRAVRRARAPNKLPKFAFNVELTSGGRTVAGGAAYDGSKGFITLQGTPYEVSGLVLKQFVAGYEQSLKSRQNAQGGLVLGSARHRLPQVADEPAQRGRGAGRRREDDQDHRRGRRQAQVVADLDKIARARRQPARRGRPRPADS